MNRDGIEKTLRLHGIKPSYHRLRIYQYLLEKRNHPSADMIFRALVREIPSLSKATVYNTLNLLAEKGLILSLGIVDNEARFDAETMLHGHFLCTLCGRIQDVHFRGSPADLLGLENCAVDESHIYFKGRCAACRELNQQGHPGNDPQQSEPEDLP